MTREDAIDILTAQTGLSEERVEALARVICGLKPVSKNALYCRTYRRRNLSVDSTNLSRNRNDLSDDRLIKKHNKNNTNLSVDSSKRKEAKEKQVSKYSKRSKRREVEITPAAGQESGDAVTAWTSPDGSVSLSAVEIETLTERYPLLVNLIGSITHLVTSDWCQKQPSWNRKRAVLATIAKQHREMVAKAPKSVEISAREQQTAEIDRRTAEREEQFVQVQALWARQEARREARLRGETLQ